MKERDKKRAVLVGFHLAAWTLFFSIQIFLLPQGKTTFFLPAILAMNGLMLIFFYANTLVLLWECRGKERTAGKNLQPELSYLRAQINPHFIFNVLNSAVSLARTGSDQLEPLLIRFSNLLRYMLYTSEGEKVPLERELENIAGYIDLQKLRLGDEGLITFKNEGDFSGHSIEPMLLIPFIENAFKHGTGRIDNPAIFIDMHIKNGVLDFQVRNKFEPSLQQGTDNTGSGIGLANVTKRLGLLYDHKYSLDVKTMENWFDVKLNLVLR